MTLHTITYETRPFSELPADQKETMILAEMQDYDRANVEWCTFQETYAMELAIAHLNKNYGLWVTADDIKYTLGHSYTSGVAITDTDDMSRVFKALNLGKEFPIFADEPEDLELEISSYLTRTPTRTSTTYIEINYSFHNEDEDEQEKIDLEVKRLAEHMHPIIKRAQGEAYKILTGCYNDLTSREYCTAELEQSDREYEVNGSRSVSSTS